MKKDILGKLIKNTNNSFNNFFNKDFKIEILKDKIIVKINLQGVDKKDIVTKLTKDYIEVNAEKKKIQEVKKKGLFKSESSYKGFNKKISFPCEILPNKSKITYENKVLKIEAKKAK